MSGNPPRFVLLTRPQAASDRFAAQLRDAIPYLDIAIAPLQQIVPLPLSLQVREDDELIFTSAAGVEAFAKAAPIQPARAWCVGPRTAEAARAAGMKAQTGGGTADALVAHLIEEQPSARLIHLRGTHAIGDVAGRLRAAGLTADEAFIYDQQAVPPSPAFESAFSPPRPVNVPLFSPRSAALFFEASAHLDVSQAHVFALSAAIAQVAKSHHAGAITVAESPTAPALIRAMREVFLA